MVSWPEYQSTATGAPTQAATNQVRSYESLSTRGIVALHD